MVTNKLQQEKYNFFLQSIIYYMYVCDNYFYFYNWKECCCPVYTFFENFKRIGLKNV